METRTTIPWILSFRRALVYAFFVIISTQQILWARCCLAYVSPAIRRLCSVTIAHDSITEELKVHTAANFYISTLLWPVIVIN